MTGSLLLGGFLPVSHMLCEDTAKAVRHELKKKKHTIVPCSKTSASKGFGVQASVSSGGTRKHIAPE